MTTQEAATRLTAVQAQMVRVTGYLWRNETSLRLDIEAWRKELRTIELALRGLA